MSVVDVGTWLTVRRQRIVRVKCNKDYGEGTCEGEITMWDRPSDWKTFPKCAKHLAEAVQEFERINRTYGVTSDVPPPDFDPLACGERWDED